MSGLPADGHSDDGGATSDQGSGCRPDAATHPTARRMVAAARRILARDGFAALTLEAVSAEAGVNKASTRYYFGGKQGLIEAVIREIVLDECAAVQSPVEPEGRPSERVDALVARARYVATDADSFSGFFEVLPQVRKSAATRREFMELYERWFAWNLEWLMLTGDDLPESPKRGLGMLISAVIDGLAVQQTIFGPGYDPDDCIALFREILMGIVEGGPRSPTAGSRDEQELRG